MDYKLLNKIEATLKRCCTHPLGELEGLDAGSLIAYQLKGVLKGEELTEYDWLIISAAIREGMAAAAEKAIKMLANSLDMISGDDREHDQAALVGLVDRLIKETYDNVETIRHRVLVRGDSPGYERLQFVIHLSGKPEQILADEKRFRAKFFNVIPEAKQDLCLITYRVKDEGNKGG